MAADEDDLTAFAEQIGALGVEDLLLSSVSTFLAVGQAKLDRNELADARKAIDAAVALLPHLPEEARRALQPSLAGLQVVYAAAASP